MGSNYYQSPDSLKLGNGYAISCHTCWSYDYLCMLGLKLFHMNKRYILHCRNICMVVECTNASSRMEFHLKCAYNNCRCPTAKLSRRQHKDYMPYWWKCWALREPVISLQWRHNEHDGVSNHQRHDCLLNRLFRRRSRKIPKLRVIGLCAGNSPVNFLRKGPVTRKMFLFDDVIMMKRDIMKCHPRNFFY